MDSVALKQQIEELTKQELEIRREMRKCNMTRGSWNKDTEREYDNMVSTLSRIYETKDRLSRNLQRELVTA